MLNDEYVDDNYYEITEKRFEGVPRWDVTFEYHKDLGRTTRAGIVTALELAKNVSNKNFLVIHYDKADRYSSFEHKGKTYNL